MDRFCPTCNADGMPMEGDTFCFRCGTRLIANPTHSCGRRLTPVDVFCPKCGEQVAPSPLVRALKNDPRLVPPASPGDSARD
jgi:predicted amidophosphoribosyltransferase